MGRQRKANAKRRNARTCQLCEKYFDRDKTRARIMPCGHTLCTSCISVNIRKNQVRCPSCRRKHKASVAGDFPINIDLERFILVDLPKPIADSVDSDELHPVLSEPPNRALVLSDAMNKILTSMREEIIRNLKKPGVDLKEVRAQYQQYRSLVDHWKEYYRKSTSTYKSISQQLEEMINSLQEESERVSKALEEGVRERENLMRAKEHLDAAQTAMEVIPAIVEADICYDVVLNWNLQAQSSFPNEELLKKSDLLNEKAEKALMTYSAVEKRLTRAKKDVKIVEEAARAVAAADVEANDSNAAHPA